MIFSNNQYCKQKFNYKHKIYSSIPGDTFVNVNFRDPSILAECGLDEHTKEVLLNNIKRKLTSQAVKIRADVEVACYGYEGIDAVKTALKAGLALSTDELPIKINLIAPPLYGMLYIIFQINCIRNVVSYMIIFSHDDIYPGKTGRLKGVR